MKTATLSVWNKRIEPHVVLVEPWAFDFTLMPGERLEVIAMERKKQQPFFEVAEKEGVTEVWCNEADDFKVTQGDKELKCGHQRQSRPHRI